MNENNWKEERNSYSTFFNKQAFFFPSSKQSYFSSKVQLPPYEIPRGCTPSYILHTRAFGSYLLGVSYLAKRIVMWWYFTCNEPPNIVCDGILHVNMFHYFKIPYITCEYIEPNYLLHIVSKNFASAHPPREIHNARNGKLSQWLGKVHLPTRKWGKDGGRQFMKMLVQPTTSFTHITITMESQLAPIVGPTKFLGDAQWRENHLVFLYMASGLAKWTRVCVNWPCE